VRCGYRCVHVLLRRERWRSNQKTRWIYGELNLQLYNKTPKRRAKAKLRGDRNDRTKPAPMDFVHDQLATDRRYLLTLLLCGGVALRLPQR
jgi:putative transposase